MGQNLILNMNDKGFTVACYNRYVFETPCDRADFAQYRVQG